MFSTNFLESESQHLIKGVLFNKVHFWKVILQDTEVLIHLGINIKSQTIRKCLLNTLYFLNNCIVSILVILTK